MQITRLGIGPQASQSERARRLGHHAGVFKNILDSAADGVRFNSDDVVKQVAAQNKGFFTHQLDGHAVGKQTHIVQFHPLPGHDGTPHGVGIHRLHADDADFRPQVFDIGGNARRKAAPADGDKHGVDVAGVLAQDFHADGTLARDNVRVVKGRNIHAACFLNQVKRVLPGIAERLSGKHNLTTQPLHSLDLDGGRGHGHDDGSLAAQLARAKGNALSMIASRGGNNAPAQFFIGKVRHLVVGASNLEGKNRLEVFALEQNIIAGAARKTDRLVQRGFYRHVVHAAQKDTVQVFAVLVHENVLAGLRAWPPLRSKNAFCEANLYIPARNASQVLTF